MAIYDVVNKYSWTSVPKNTPMRREAPKVIVTPFKLIGSQLNQYINGYVNIGNMDPEKFYRNLYKVNKTGNEYQFPYLSDNIKSFGNSFTESFGNFSSKGAVNGVYNAGQSIMTELAGSGLGAAEIVSYLLNDTSDIVNGLPSSMQGAANTMIDASGAAAGAVGLPTGNAGSYLETPQLYQFENTDAPLDVSFTLSNTIDENDAEMNKALIDDLVKLNKPERLSAIHMTYPHIYRIMVPGQRYMFWAYMSNFSVSLLGNRREINGKLVPEGYNITMSFKSLIIETSNFTNKL